MAAVQAAQNAKVRAANIGLQAEKQTLQQQQAAKGINNPQSLVTLQAQLHNKQITPQQFTQQFAKASKGAAGANNTNMANPTPFKVTPGVVASSVGQAAKKIALPIAKGTVQSEQTVANVGARLLPGGQNDIKAEQQNTQSNISSQQFINGLLQTGKISPTQAAKIQKQGQLNIAQNTRNIQKTAASIPTRGQAAAGVLGTAADVLTAGALPEVKGAGLIPKAANGAVEAGSFGTASGLNAAAGGGNKKQIAENVVAGAAFPLGLKGLAKGAGVASAALGKDQAVNDLINNTRTQTAQDLIKNTAQKAQTRSNLGGTVVKEANTTRIPVVSPTETNAARTSVGSTAVNNADRTSIPVTGKSTQVVGKSASIDTATYTKQSQQLSKAYDKEVSALKDQPPVVQKILQGRIDTKYQALQQNLDESAGRTNVSFNSKPTTIPEPKANKVPSPAGDVTPKTAPVSVEAGAGGSVGRASAEEPTAAKAPTTEAPSAPGTKVSGSALKSETRAVQAGLVKDLGDKATYDTGSYKAEAAKAVGLTHNDPDTAKAIAMGQKPGDNTIHEVAVRHAVEQKAIKEGDTQTLLDLSKSTQHTATSESAQRLGAEGYSTNATSPVAKITEVNDTRKAAFENRTGTTVNKAASKEIQAIRSATPKVTIKTWGDFVESLKC
jgi:hypothetical protein